jgi:hypothetical protein
MNTKELITKLQKLDPSGKLEVRIGLIAKEIGDVELLKHNDFVDVGGYTVEYECIHIKPKIFK